MAHRLSRRALKVLLNGRFAHLGGASHRERARRLAAVASAYSRSELLDERGIGAVTAREIELWLTEQGLELRPDPVGNGLAARSLMLNAALN